MYTGTGCLGESPKCKSYAAHSHYYFIDPLEHTSKKMKENTKNKRGTIISIGNAATSESGKSDVFVISIYMYPHNYVRLSLLYFNQYKGTNNILAYIPISN